MSFINISIESGISKRERDDNEIMMESDEEIGKSEGEMGEEERDVIESLISSTLANQSDAFSPSEAASSSSSSTFTLPSKSSSFSKQSGSNRKRQLSLEPIESIHLSPASIAASSKISCLECRASKTRCSGGDICERCKRLSKECIYREHRRGRFSDSKRVQHLERVVESLLGQLKSLQASQNETRKTSSTNSLASSTKNESSSSLPNATAPALPEQQNDLWKLIDSRSSSPILDVRQNTLESLLSHPLRFMAQFGKDVGLNEGIHENNQHPTSQTDYQDTVLNAQIGNYTPRITPSMSSATDQTSFLKGLRIVKLDRFDPIEMGIISLSKSEQLFRLYFDLLESSVTMFDVDLHSFEFVRTTSSFLLTTICFLASMFDMETNSSSNSLTKRLEGHIYQIILPAILTQDYRSVEIVQAFVLLANYHPQITSLSQDRSWLFIGYASRIGWELGMNKSMQDAILRFQNDTELIKRIRNRERTWLNVWITEMALCELMGMAPMMRFDSIVISLGSWHLHPHSLPADHAIVALVQLRLILAKQAEMCEGFILQNHQTQQNDPNRLVEMMKMTYRQSIERLNAWSNAWSQDPYASNISSQHPRFRRARICYWYARVMSASRILRFTFETQNSFSFDLYLDIYNACIAFLHQILHTQNGVAFQYSNNCSIILPTYCSIICLSLIRIIQNSTSIDRSRLNMDVENTLDLITNVSETLNQAATITPHRRGIANNYGPFLRAVLQKVKDRVQTESSTNKGKSVPLRNPSVMQPSPIASVLQGYDSRQYNIPAPNGIFNEPIDAPQTHPMYWQQAHLGGGIIQAMQPNLQVSLNQTDLAGQQQQQQQQGENNSNNEMFYHPNELEGAQLYNLIFGPNDYSSFQQQQQQFQQNQKPS